jgi:carbamoyl-phosphate synthase small subunit
MAAAARGGELRLADGRLFGGTGFGWPGEAEGEVVFNTGMVGYTETLTDPSYRGQILVLTYPLVGNYGVPAYRRDGYGCPVGFESEAVQVAGLVVSSHCVSPSHHSSRMTLDQWLRSEGVPGVCGVDTRALTRHLRRHGTLPGTLTAGAAPCRDRRLSSGSGVGPASAAEDGPEVAVVDCGCKASILRSLASRGLVPKTVAPDQPLEEVECSGILLSNGPGDPAGWRQTVEGIRPVLESGLPILGICLGSQLIALAAGAETEKMAYGHRSQNQPCVETGRPDGEPRVLVTSQNHGYQVRKESVPGGWSVWFENANDGSVEGIRHRRLPVRGVQFHPEAGPGPLDAGWIFDSFAGEVMQVYGGSRNG